MAEKVFRFTFTFHTFNLNFFPSISSTNATFKVYTHTFNTILEISNHEVLPWNCIFLNVINFLKTRWLKVTLHLKLNCRSFINDINQGGSARGPQASCGPRNLFCWSSPTIKLIIFLLNINYLIYYIYIILYQIIYLI